MKTLFVWSCFILCFAAFGCSSLTLAPVHYQWPIESVIPVDGKGNIDDARNFIVINVKPLLFEETKDSVHVSGIELRVIRDMDGYYFMTAAKFKNVYVFAPDEGKLKLEKKIPVSETGLTSPAFNADSKGGPIHLLNGKDKPMLLSKNGVEQGGQK
jgi:hypothetical protein